MKEYTFIYSTHPEKKEKKEITITDKNQFVAYANLVNELNESATFVENKTTGERII